MTLYGFLFLWLFFFSEASSQTLSNDFSQPTIAAPSYQVIALMVEFEADTSRFTSGDGTFSDGIYDGLEPSIDPLPHDANYFNAHLSFLENYVESVSNGATNLDIHLLGGAVKVSGEMGGYSPTGPNSDSDEELAKLAKLVDEAWTLADQEIDADGLVVQSDNVAFMIFHAGSGRDVELTGSALDRTPEDIPSLFFNQESLNRLLEGGSPSFKGAAVTNTIILPETESRLGSNNITGERLILELSINGLIAASFFNFLGVPDLFNTETGTSAIGPYGLMDPYGIFAFNGLFAPEPSAWTKEFLGWTSPILANPSSGNTYSVLAGENSVKVPISDSEYFLVENRQRDPRNEGLLLSIWNGNEIVEQRFSTDDDDSFNSTNTSAFDGGVVVSANNYDWALPGGRGTDDVIRNGGILIWHVDQNIINESIAENAVNTRVTMRGIDLEEADSAQDLGFPPISIFQAAFDRGTPFDYYYQGNPVLAVNQNGTETRLYSNSFGPNTFPDSDANSGASSLVEIAEFSESANEMTFVVRSVTDPSFEVLAPFVDGGIDFESRPQAENALSYSPGLANQNPAIIASFFDNEGLSTLHSTIPDDRFVRSLSTDDFVPISQKPIVIETLEGSSVLEIGSWQGNQTAIALWLHDQLSRNTPPFSVFVLPSILPEFVVGPLMAPDDSGQRLFVGVSNNDGNGYLDVNANGTIIFNKSPLQDLVSVASSGELVFVAGTTGASAMKGQDLEQNWIYQTEGDDFQIVAGKDSRGYTISFVDNISNVLHLLNSEGVVARVALESYLGSEPILYDLNDDSYLETLLVSNSALYAFHNSGALVSGFPIELESNSSSQIIVGETENGPQAIVTGNNGVIYRVTLDGLKDPSLIALGGLANTTPYLKENELYALSGNGRLYGWALSGVTGSTWNQQYANKLNWSFVEDLEGSPTSEGDGLFVSDEFYNWPNPARDDGTNIRFLLNEDAIVSIKIVDFAGNLVFEIDNIDARAHIPEDLFWEAEVARGVYFAQIEGVSAAGTVETELVKIGVLR